jgi:Co/Zn/Cd efflux system component
MVNIVSTLLLAKYQDTSLDIRAVWLCTRNDAMNNVLIIIA